MIVSSEGEPRSFSLLARIRAVAGRLKRLVFRSLDRLLHSTRRARAIDRLQGTPNIQRVLFLCLGNVCRSPYAEARFRERMRSFAEARSAGFIGPGRPPPSDAIEVARARGVETSEHRSQLVTPAMLDEADLVVLMDLGQLRRLKGVGADVRAPIIFLGDLDPERIPGRGIKDPWGRSSRIFDQVFERMDRCIDQMASHLPREATLSRPETSEATSR